MRQQTGHNDYPVKDKDAPPGYFVIVTGPEQVKLYVCGASHRYVYYSQPKLDSLASALHMDPINIPPNSVFIGHGHLQHAGAEWTGSHSLRYHIYVTPEGQHLPDAILFAYGHSLPIATQVKVPLAVTGGGRSSGRQGQSSSSQMRDIEHSEHSTTKSVVDNSKNKDKEWFEEDTDEEEDDDIEELVQIGSEEIEDK